MAERELNAFEARSVMRSSPPAPASCASTVEIAEGEARLPGQIGRQLTHEERVGAERGTPCLQATLIGEHVLDELLNECPGVFRRMYLHLHLKGVW